MRCNCGRSVEPVRNKVLQLHLSNDICDVYECPNFSKFLDDKLSSHEPRRPYTKFNHNRKPFDTESNSPGVIKFFFKALAKSSINGVSNFSASHSAIAKLIWLVVFISCVVGFGYQAQHFYEIYKNKPTVVQIEVENDGEVDFPAVTVCTTNRFRKRVFCRIFPKKCESVPYKNITISEQSINEILYDLLLKKEKDVRNDLGHSKTIFESCVFVGTPNLGKEECMSVWEDFYDPDYGNCFTFPAKNKDDVSLQARKVDFWQEENDLVMVMDEEPEEFMEARRSPGLLLVVHDNKALPDIHTEGVMLNVGYSYTITVDKTTVILLPPPYKTNCTDYSSLPWQQSSKKRLTSRFLDYMSPCFCTVAAEGASLDSCNKKTNCQMCTVGCSQHLQLQKCKYVTKSLSLFYQELPYSEEDITPESIKCAEEVEIDTQNYCRTICGLPCKNTYFTPTVGVALLSEKEVSHDLHDREYDNMSIFEDIVHVRIFYSTLEHKIFRHVPKYDTMELLGFLGGYSGVWLGFSLLTVYELLEIIVSTVFYFFRKREYQKQNKKFLKTIFNSRKSPKTTVKTWKKKKKFTR